MEIEIDSRRLGPQQPTYFIADIAANHDGSLDRARKLIHLAKEAGADAAKFQHFKASKIVSDHGFKNLSNTAHQASWSKSVFEVYEEVSVPPAWTESLFEECQQVGITFLSTPYDFDSVDELDPFVSAFKIGSGDIDWIEALQYVASKGKPVLLATGASSMGDVIEAVTAITAINPQLVLMQCNTNYTNSESNFDHLHLNVLKVFAQTFPDLILGLSDHTHGPAAVLGAVALGARVIERHFTDDNARVGPDHAFALTPEDWQEMVAETRRLERALGLPLKKVNPNELETEIVQRRCIRAARDIEPGEVITRSDLEVLRPAVLGGISPSLLQGVVGRTAQRHILQGTELKWFDISE